MLCKGLEVELVGVHSDAAVEAWKAGVASMLGETSSSSENSMGVTAAETVRQKMSLRDGKVYMQLDHSLRASVVQMDLMERILWERLVQNFSAGEHVINLPQNNAKTQVRLVIQ